METKSTSAFALLSPTIQEQLYKMRWTELHQIQVDAIHAVMRDDNHLIITAMTAGGKTEAAFLPVFSRIVDDCQNGIRALYVSPLKALINDQFRRLEDLCELSSIPVHKWHGDVSQAAKSKLLKKPSGVLLITPESIESLFINRPAFLLSLFARLSYIVIDEVHAFIGTERGAHMKSLISRLTKFSTDKVRIIGLSATIGDIELAKKWLFPENSQSVGFIEGEGGKSVRYLIKGYLRSPSVEKSEVNHDLYTIGTDGKKVTPDDIRLTNDIIKAFYGKTALIFANSRARLEFYADITKRALERQHIPDRFRIHHGSLSKSEREDTEKALRSDVPAATFCSSTLELGIDVGNVSRVGQIGCPWSVSSLTQRLGRSGRRDGEASEMWVYISEDEPTDKSQLVERLFPELIQSIAMTELMLAKWHEAPDAGRLHLSTLVQQVMSVIAERGATTARVLHSDLIKEGAFVNVDKESFAAVLRSMENNDLIEMTPEGELILGLTGERIVRSFDFYSAFVSSKERLVMHKSHKIGTIAAPSGIGTDTYLILAGRRWKIIEVDAARKVILVEPSKGGRAPYFAGSSGADIHPHIRARMKEILCADDYPIYLDPKARGMLRQARRAAQVAQVANQTFVSDGRDVLWFTWTGSRINRTLSLLGSHFADLDVSDEGIALLFYNTDPTAIARKYKALLTNPPSAEDIASKIDDKMSEKYDRFLSKELLNSMFSTNHLDISAAVEAIQAMLQSFSPK